MTIFNTCALLVVLTACFSYINYKYLRLPKTIGLTLISLGISLLIAVLGFFKFEIASLAAKTVSEINFSDALLKMVLSFLLFAGALHIDLGAFLGQKWAIGVLSTLGVVISTFVVGIGVYYLLPLFGLSFPLPLCLLFGALISPTDPIAVLALLKHSKIPKSIEMKIAGESLLNDGVGVVLFLAILSVVVSGSDAFSIEKVSILLAREAFGGIAFGLIAGFVAYQFIKRVDNYEVEILLTLALVIGGYALAQKLHVSGPLAMVVAGLFIGNHGRAFGMSEKTRQNLDLFWEVVDDVLNAALFVLVGFEALLLNVKSVYVFVALSIVPLTLFARFISVWISSHIAGIVKKFSTHAVIILTWGGLRGGISLALVLALPHGESRDVLLLATYMVVVFTILVQGLTMKTLLKRLGM